jgi:hypothetical protein
MVSIGSFAVFSAVTRGPAVIVFDEHHLIPTEERPRVTPLASDMRLVWLDLLFAILVLSAIASL